MEREFSGGLGGPTVSTPNSKETSPSRSLSGQYESCYFLHQFLSFVSILSFFFNLHAIYTPISLQQIPLKWNCTVMKIQVAALKMKGQRG